ncbi:VOC family protein [Massilia niastensis]|uniref:VOC family protein n=1 Tax=Massilia niastensis TaxID=544911 RepID=UPI00035C4DB1|nr:VOC family protein [Massilia niastensis]
MQVKAHIVPCLWFDTQAEEAANFYVSVFPNSRITQVSHYGEEGREVHGMAPGTVLTVAFELDGQPFTALNGGPAFRFSEAVSFQVRCDTQDEIDRYWEVLGAGGDEAARQCGWLKDRYGLSWQVMPGVMDELIVGPRSEQVMAALMPMKKLDLAALLAAGGRGDGAGV